MEKLLTIAECAELVGVHEQTIRNHIKSGLLKASRLGAQWRIKPEDLAKYINGGGDNV